MAAFYEGYRQARFPLPGPPRADCAASGASPARSAHEAWRAFILLFSRPPPTADWLPGRPRGGLFYGVSGTASGWQATSFPDCIRGISSDGLGHHRLAEGQTQPVLVEALGHLVQRSDARRQVGEHLPLALLAGLGFVEQVRPVLQPPAHQALGNFRMALQR